MGIRTSGIGHWESGISAQLEADLTDPGVEQVLLLGHPLSINTLVGIVQTNTASNILRQMVNNLFLLFRE